jgi:hypothetical protein
VALDYGWRDKLLEGGRETLASKEERQGERKLRRKGQKFALVTKLTTWSRPPYALRRFQAERGLMELTRDSCGRAARQSGPLRVPRMPVPAEDSPRPPPRSME